jgi:hypothetical protein
MGRRLPPDPRRGKNERPSERARERLCLKGLRIASESYEFLRQRAVKEGAQDSAEFKFGVIQTSRLSEKRTLRKRKNQKASPDLRAVGTSSRAGCRNWESADKT